MCCALSQHSTVSSKVLVLYFSIFLEYQRWPGCIPSMREMRWESSWGNYRTSRWLNHWWRPFEPQRGSRKLNYPHNLFVLYVHPSVVPLPLPCVCVCLWRLFSITSLNVWNPPDLLYSCTWPDLTMSYLQDITSFMVSHDSERLCPQLQRFRDMRWCMEAPDILSLVIRLKVIFFGHFGLLSSHYPDYSYILKIKLCQFTKYIT